MWIRIKRRLNPIVPGFVPDSHTVVGDHYTNKLWQSFATNLWSCCLQRLAINCCRQASIHRCVKIAIKWEYNGVNLLSAYHWTNWQLHAIYDSTAINYDKSLKITNLQLSAYREIYINNLYSESSQKFVHLKQKFRNVYINVQVVAARW